MLADEEVSGRSSARTYLGFLVPGVVMTPTGALSSPAAKAQRMRAQNATSMSKWLAYVACRWISSSSLIGAVPKLAHPAAYNAPSHLRLFCVKLARADGRRGQGPKAKGSLR